MIKTYNEEYHWIYLYVKPFYKADYRRFHNTDHLNKGLSVLSDLNLSINKEQYIAWLFHDIVYFPGYDKNEEMSAQYMLDFCKIHNLDINTDLAHQIIMDTKQHKSTIEESKIVLDIDMYTLGQPSYEDFRTDRMNVVFEYERFCGGVNKAEEGVLDFLKNIQGKTIFCTEAFQKFQSCFDRNVQEYIKSEGKVILY